VVVLKLLKLNFSQVKIMDIYELLQKIRKRPDLYLGKPSLEHLQVFLDGYTFARRQLNLPLTEQEQEFEKFQIWIEHKFNLPDTQSWTKIILFYSANERDALQRFFELLDEFIQERRKSPEARNILVTIA
jgi:cytochrome P450